MSTVKRLLTVLLVATVLVVVPTAAPAQERAGAAAVDTITLDGVKVKLRKKTSQVVTVNRTEGWHARVTYWAKQDGEWVERFQASDGAIGYNGLVRPRKRVQGSGRTPAGTFRLPWAFGMPMQHDGWDRSYRKVRKGDYWVLDNESKHYNRYRNKDQGGFRWWLDSSHADASERLKDYPNQYEWAVVTSFNRAQVEHRGGAIFLHVNGSGATAGCASAPRWFMRKRMFRLDQDRRPLIAIGS